MIVKKSMELTLETLLQINPDILVTQLDDSEGRPESVLLHMVTQEYFGLNSTGVYIWDALQRGLPLSAAANELSQSFDVTLEKAEASVLRLARELLDAGLVDYRPEA